MRSRLIVSSLIGAGIVAASIAVPAMPAVALDPVTYTIDCSYVADDVATFDKEVDIPIYAGQDAVFVFSPATCKQSYWSEMNPALENDTLGELVGTASVTIAAADVLCDNEWDVVMGDNATYNFLTFTGCEAAPAAAPEAAPLPDTGIDATALGLAAAGLLAAGVATIVVVRRRNA
jgi:LPXTG-motif cell wall-anchored protein